MAGILNKSAVLDENRLNIAVFAYFMRKVHFLVKKLILGENKLNIGKIGLISMKKGLIRAKLRDFWDKMAFIPNICYYEIWDFSKTVRGLVVGKYFLQYENRDKSSKIMLFSSKSQHFGQKQSYLCQPK